MVQSQSLLVRGQASVPTMASGSLGCSLRVTTRAGNWDLELFCLGLTPTCQSPRCRMQTAVWS